jgi:cysteine desulfurase
MIYADWNATTPLHPEVRDAMRAAEETAWANPSSVHGPGRAARAMLERARARIGSLTGFDPRDVLLVSGGTEANNVAIRSLARLGPVVTSAIEHPSIARTAEQLAREGVSVTFAPVDARGVVDADAIERALAGGARGVSLQLVNHETGVIQPVAEVAARCRQHGALLHVDAVQGVGHLDPDAWAGAHALTVTAHKLQGPKGIGALAHAPTFKPISLLHGGAQEKGIRPGTQDPIASAGFARAIELVLRRERGAAAARDALEQALIERGAVINGSGLRVAHVTNASFAMWLGPELVAALDLEGVAVSSGAACSAGTTDPSPVIAAMVGVDRARRAVRFSLEPRATADQVSELIAVLDRVLARGSRLRDAT